MKSYLSAGGLVTKRRAAKFSQCSMSEPVEGLHCQTCPCDQGMALRSTYLKMLCDRKAISGQADNTHIDRFGVAASRRPT